MKKTVLTAALSVLCVCAGAQTEEWTERLDSIVVSSTRAGENTPVTYSTMGKDQLRSSNPMNSLPMTLNLLPSVVTYNEGGTGLGNSAMTIRGSKGSQINVTLNGITLTDAESQEVFWVNIPALTSLISHVQVQRGLGTSANGAGAFGASINMNTGFVTPDPFATLEVGAGSYGTLITTLSASTGLTDKGFYATAAYAKGTTDGYIRNAFVQSQSGFVTLGWLRGRNSLRLTYLVGDQRSGITWDGISLEQYALDRRYNEAGEYTDDSGRTCYYDNQTDNYTQHHVQLNYTRALTDRLSWSNTLDYSRGDGYDEYYKTGRKYAEFGFPFSEWDGAKKSDMIYRKKMGNDLWVFNSDLRFRSDRLDVTGGVYLSRYDGGHWGEMLWAKGLGETYDYASLNAKSAWYRNQGRKDDLSAFVRSEYRPLEWLTAYVDLQYRHIGYDLTGRDDKVSSIEMDYHKNWDFFNPRAGLTARLGRHKIFASVALGNREPGRSDIKENIKGESIPIRPESMVDVEAGYGFSASSFSASANVYLMEYTDMLLETGKLSSSGYAIKENVPRAWRRGIELSAAWAPARWLRLDGNTTLSVNEIDDYTAYVEIDDYSGRTHPVPYGRTQMLMSPSVIGMLQMEVTPWRGVATNSLKTTALTLDGKYVGRQFLDNSMRDEMAIPAYYVANLSVSHRFQLGRHARLRLAAYVNNLFNLMYYASGWRWESYNEETGSVATGVGVYPQAPRNYMLKMTLSF